MRDLFNFCTKWRPSWIFSDGCKNVTTQPISIIFSFLAMFFYADHFKIQHETSVSKQKKKFFFQKNGVFLNFRGPEAK